jgi:hypothetical protein
MKWKDREGKEVTWSEFKTRWKSGIQKVTPSQQVKSQILFTYITIIGLLCGIVVSIWKFSTLWWLGIILLAGLGNTIVGLVGIYQKKFQLQKYEDIIKEQIKQDHMNKAFYDMVKDRPAIEVKEREDERRK